MGLVSGARTCCGLGLRAWALAEAIADLWPQAIRRLRGPRTDDLWRDFLHPEPDPAIILAELLGRDSPCCELDDLFQDWVETWWS